MVLPAHHISNLTQLIPNCNNVPSLSKVYTQRIVHRLIKDDNHLAIHAIIRCVSLNLPNHAISVYSSLSNPTLRFQNLVFRALSNHGYHSHLLSLYSRLRKSGSCQSDHFTFPLVLKACAVLNNIRTGKMVHSLVVKSGHGGNTVQTSLLDMYAKNCRLYLARKVFDEILERDLVSWNALIVGYASYGHYLEALESFKELLYDNLRPNDSTLVSIIRIGSLNVKKSLHGFGIKLGFANNESVVSSLITMYSSFEDFEASIMLLKANQQKSLVLWNTMISSYSQNRRHEETFRTFALMHRENISPDMVTIISVLQPSSDLYRVELVHCIAIKLMLAKTISVSTSLVSAYSKVCDLFSATTLFSEVSEKNLLLYNTIMSAYIQHEVPEIGLSTFRGMQDHGIIPDSISLISVLSGCSLCKCLSSGKSIHAYIVRGGLESNVNLMNALLALYSDCGRYDDIHTLFRVMKARDSISWNSMISVLTKNGDAIACIDTFRKMQLEIKFDIITMISIIPSIYLPEHISSGMSFHALAFKSGFESDISLRNALITMYCNCSNMESAYLLFKSISLSRTIISWNAIMTGYRNHNLPEKVMTLFHEMMIEGHKPNSVTLLNLFPCCDIMLKGKSIHAYAVKHMFHLENSQILTSAMCMYARFEDLSTCSVIFNTMEMDKENVVTWNTMMSIHSQSNLYVRRTMAYFKEMLMVGVKPDIVSMLTLVPTCTSLSTLGSLTSFAIYNGFDKSTAFANALIDSYAKCGSLTMARELFDDLKLKDSITWSVMINAYGMHGKGKEAFGLFHDMVELGFVPDDVTYVSVLSACSHSGLVEEARVVFGSISDPKLKHYNCVIDVLSRNGNLDEAYGIVKRMVSKGVPCVKAVEGLLGACRTYGNVIVGEAIEKLLCVMHDDSLSNVSASSHVMISNIYAKSEGWSDCWRVRCDMEAMGLKKNPAFSFVLIH